MGCNTSKDVTEPKEKVKIEIIWPTVIEEIKNESDKNNKSVNISD